MKEFYVKPPAKVEPRMAGQRITFKTSTAYICRQSYDGTEKRTKQVLVASFNLATDPSDPVINVTARGDGLGYEVTSEHRAMVQKFLLRHGTSAKTKVPREVLARVRAAVERQLRDELKAASQVEDSTVVAAEPDVAANGPTTPPLVAQPPDENELPEATLVRLLRAIETACEEVAALMPESARKFKRGHDFRPETVLHVQRVWFKVSDAIAALNGRQPLKRPKNWEPMRNAVFSGNGLSRDEAPCR